MATFQKIKDILADELAIDEGIITPASRLTEDLGADSLDQVEIIMRVEEEFGIEVPDEDAEQLVTVADVVAYVEAKANV